jgi:hypothetical protein
MGALFQVIAGDALKHVTLSVYVVLSSVAVKNKLKSILINSNSPSTFISIRRLLNTKMGALFRVIAGDTLKHVTSV